MLACVRLSGSEADVDYVWVPFYMSTPQFPAWESNIDLPWPLKDLYSPSLLWWQETRLLRPFVLYRFHVLTHDRCIYIYYMPQSTFCVKRCWKNASSLFGQKWFKYGKGRVRCQSLFWASGPWSLQSLVGFIHPATIGLWLARERAGWHAFTSGTENYELRNAV